jgi:hypothetical protein
VILQTLGLLTSLSGLLTAALGVVLALRDARPQGQYNAPQTQPQTVNPEGPSTPPNPGGALGGSALGERTGAVNRRA